jgi:hypothetical protein
MFYKLLLFLTLISLASCNDRHSNKRKPVVKVSSALKTIPNLKIFIEDGGSMKGFFFDPNFSFSSDISKLFSNLNANSKQLNLISNNDIKKLKCENDLEFSSYISNLNKLGRFAGESSFEKMLPIVIDKCNSKTVSVFVSDYIQSSADLTNNIAGDYIANVISKKTLKNKSFSIGILKMHSRFKGEFYFVSEERKDQSPNPDTIDSEKPYYIWFFGDKDFIETLNLNFTNLTGFDDFSVYNQTNYDDLENEVNWSILQHTNSKGIFKPSRDFKNEITDAEPDRISNEFQTCIAIDLSNIPISEALKIDANNYFLHSKGFKIQAISKLNDFDYNYLGEEMKIDDKDKQTIAHINATHLIFLNSNQNVIDNIEISLKRGVSPNLINSNSSDENKLGDSQTFGFKNFTDAISTCFEKYDNSFYFTKKIIVKNSSKGLNGMKFIFVLFIIIGGILIFIKIKKR